jgi:hypothetical protein
VCWGWKGDGAAGPKSSVVGPGLLASVLVEVVERPASWVSVGGGMDSWDGGCGGAFRWV